MTVSSLQDQLIAYENDMLDFDDTLSMFQYIYETEAYKWLQGHYGRTLKALIEEGYIATFDEED